MKMIEKIVQRLEDESLQPGHPERMEEAAAKLHTVKRLWAKFGDDPLVMKMQNVVRAVVKAYHLDFYELDLLRMEQIGVTPFYWFVRPHGTDLLPKEGDEDTIRSAQAWFEAIRINYGDRSNRNEAQRLYLCCPKSKSWKQIKFTDVRFESYPMSERRSG